ncbi:MAG: hypothetical protein HY430_02235 [Candidatus Levybacteria bacterium]|nr:hypothetical protein [Candidatus Levybacteria bacterium]
MDELKSRVINLMEQNRRTHQGHSYTVPSPASYPYQWLWDSCFHAIILSHFDLEAAKQELLSLTVKQFENGMIPHMIYWQKQSETDFPVIQWGKEDTSSITQPPMLAYAVWEIYKKEKNKAFLETMYPSLLKFYRYFLDDRDARHNHLISIINPDESGEDNSPRFDTPLGLPPKHTLDENYKKRLELIAKNKSCNFVTHTCMKNFFWVKDVPFNAILVENLKIASLIASELQKDEDAEFLYDHTRKVIQAMRKYMFEDGVFWSLYSPTSKIEQQAAYEKIKVNTWAIFSPLFADIYSRTEADFVIKTYLLNPFHFKLPYMVPTVSHAEPLFDPNGFWRGPVWISINWFIYKGLVTYGYDDLAEKLFTTSLSLVEKSGFREQFNPLTGEGYGAQNFTWGGLVLDMQK